ncbi:MAG: DUF4126 domain-containing protein [Bryobacteraceae bacterium]
MDIFQVLGSTLGLGFLSGIRLYATVLALGLAIRFHLLHLNDQMANLSILGDTKILIAAGAACALEFLADKVPWIDSAWDAAHTFIRPIAAAVLAATALGDMNPVLKTVLSIVCGGVALTSHSTKAATRLAVNHSPEPFSNLALSFAEDVAAPVGLWVVWQYPVFFLCALTVFLVVFAIVAPRVFRLIRMEFTAVGAKLNHWFGESTLPTAPVPEAALANEKVRALWDRMSVALDEVPEGMADASGASLGLHCAATGSVPGLKRSIGYLCVSGDRLMFVTRRMFRTRTWSLPLAGIRDTRWRGGFFLDQLVIVTSAGDVRFDVFKVAEGSSVSSRATAGASI